MKRHSVTEGFAIAVSILFALVRPATGADEVPFKGSLEGIRVSSTPLDPPFVLNTVIVTGNATHLGSYQLTITLIVDTANLTSMGTYEFVASNGDILTAEFAGTAETTPTPGVNSIVEIAIVTGGTGRFRREPQGLPIGTPAPDFELPDLAGVRHKLSEFRGPDVLLIFFNPKCGFCTKMAADLAALPLEGGNGRAVPVVVTTGDAEENRKLVAQHGIRCTVLLQEQMEVASQYRAQGTPMGYRIDAAGKIASELTIGGEALLRLAERAPSADKRGPTGKGSTRQGKQPDPSLARSRINRSGLKAGETAPEFALPRIDGGELSLADFRGGRVLLVFSDPNCGPCDELAPRLQELHVTRPDLQVLVISRRDVDATRAKAESLGLMYPIVMQKQWELSMKYGMFATPIGYLIDEQGVLLSDVAVGVEPILALAEEEAPALTETEPSMNGKEIARAT